MVKRLLICSILCILLILTACVSTPDKKIAENTMLSKAVVLDLENNKVTRPLKPGEQFCIVFFVNGDSAKISARFILQFEGEPVYEDTISSHCATIEEVELGVHKITIPFRVPFDGIPAGNYSVLLVVIVLNKHILSR